MTSPPPRKSVLYVFYGLLGALALAGVGLGIYGVHVFSTGGLTDTQILQRDQRVSEGLDIEINRQRVPYVMFRPGGDPLRGNAKTGDRTSTNSLGFNSPEIAREKGPNEFRIAMVGGSTAFSIGRLAHLAPDDPKRYDKSIIGQLSLVLKARLPALADMEVTYINAGIPSAVSAQELAQFIHHVLPLNIDLLVVFNGYNDTFVPFNYDPRPGYPFDYVAEQIRFYDKNSSLNFNGLVDVRQALNRIGAEYPSVEARKTGVVESYFRNVSTLVNLATGYGIRTAAFYQPYSARNNIPNKTSSQHFVHLNDAIGLAYEKLAARSNDFALFSDLRRLSADGLETYFWDEVHVSVDPGHTIIAEAMFDTMLTSGMLDELKSATGLTSWRSAPSRATGISLQEIDDLIAAGIANLQQPLPELYSERWKEVGPAGIGKGALKAGLELCAIPANACSVEELERLAQQSKVLSSDEESDRATIAGRNFGRNLIGAGKVFVEGDIKGDSDEFGPDRAVDGDLATNCSIRIGTPDDQVHFGYEFREPQHVRYIHLHQVGVIERALVQSSRDGKNWKDLRIVALYGGSQVILLDESEPALYWRLKRVPGKKQTPFYWDISELIMRADAK